MKLKLKSEAKFDAAIADTRLICMCSDDSAPAPTPQPTSTTVTNTSIPAWAQPYAETILNRASALSEAAYTPYTGQRVADFTGLQNQAFTGAASMGPNPITGQAAQQALGTTYSPYQTGQFTGDVAQQYMNPYMQAVVAQQQRDAARQSQISGTQEAAKATQAAALGGSRDAIMRAERERNLMQQMGDIQEKGAMTAFQQGQGQFNTEQQLREQSKQYGAGLGMQGLQTALTGAQQQFQQGMDANKLQQLYGTQQQQRSQDIMSQQYQDFLNQQNYPYKQLGFYSDVLHGTGQLSSGTSGTSVYQQPPSALSQMTGLGTAALGLAGKMAKGGAVKKPKRGAGLADLALAKMG